MKKHNLNVEVPKKYIHGSSFGFRQGKNRKAGGLKQDERENREGNSIAKAWLMLADPNFLNGKQIQAMLPYGWILQRKMKPFVLMESGCLLGFPAVMSDQPVLPKKVIDGGSFGCKVKIFKKGSSLRQRGIENRVSDSIAKAWLMLLDPNFWMEGKF